MTPDFYQDKARRLLIYRTDDARIMNHIPGAWPLDLEHVVVPHSLYAVQILAWLGYPVPPVMDDTGYDWPHQRRFLPADAKACPTYAQRIMSNFCVAHPRCFNLSDMGTMKTLATLWAADYIMQQHPPGACRALVVAKLSTLQRTWGDALFQHFTGRRTFQIIHHPNADRRVELLAKPADFYIVNPDGLKVGATFRGRYNVELGGFSAALFARHDIKICILDEASAFRDRRSGRSRIAQAFCAPSRMPHVWPLTGTPTPNRPTDAYGIAKLVNDCFGETYKSFEARTMVQVNLFKKVPARGSYEAAAKLLSPAVRFDIRDVWDGPAVSVIQREVELTAAQTKLLKELRSQLAATLKDGTITPANEAAMRTKALQIMQGEVYDDHHRTHGVDMSYRLNALVDLVRDATRKVLVYAPFTNVINMLVANLTKAQYSCIKLNGEVKPKDRDTLLLRFKDDPEIRVAICDPSTVSHGLNQLVAATTVVWYGPTDKTELYLQGNARAHRPGQTHPVTIAQLVASKLERDIYKNLGEQTTMQGVLLNWIKSEEI